jgi:hypothetical protein
MGRSGDCEISSVNASAYPHEVEISHATTAARRTKKMKETRWQVEQTPLPPCSEVEKRAMSLHAIAHTFTTKTQCRPQADTGVEQPRC